MKLKLSPREQVLAYITLAVIVFMLFWYMLLNPMLSSISSAGREAITIRSQINNAKNDLALFRVRYKYRHKIKIHPKEEQLNYVVSFINKKFSDFGIDLVYLKQSSPSENKLLLDINFRGRYASIIKFFKSFPELNTLIVIESVAMQQQAKGLEVNLKILTGYL